ncbi:MAG: hypothetical protein IJ789_07265 [Bacteroidales bacterium]|nr:hypothetical protein [Bacteroidales bacterium]
MPMFYTPKPRQFHYTPRFYDPEKERWEALKKKYAESHPAEVEPEAKTQSPAESDDELAYFQAKVRDLDRQQRQKKAQFTVKDLFRRRPMPTFNYTPRFQTPTSNTAETATIDSTRKNVKIKRRFDIGDDDYMKPMPAGRIMLYALLVCALLYWILF